MLSQTDPDGRTTSWAYDAAGGEASVSVDGQLTAAVERDVLRRKVSVTDYTGPEGLAVGHELVFDRRGLLVSRTRGGEGLSWEYDADGQRTRFVDAHGTVTDYARDAAGRVVGVRNSLLGAASFVHDASVRITRATVGELVQEWVYRDGCLAEHSRTDLGGAGAPEVSLIGGGASVASQKAFTGEVNWGEAGRDALIGAAAGAIGGGTASILSKFAPKVSRWGASTADKALRKVFASTGRSALSAGTGGTASNMANYHVNYKGPHTVAGYAGAAATCFGTGVLFAGISSKISAGATQRLNITPRYPEGWNPRLHAPNVQRWMTGINEGVDRFAGGMQALVNENVRPGSPHSDQGRMAAFIQGASSGASGPTAGVHSLR